jgi:hypothetical protein
MATNGAGSISGRSGKNSQDSASAKGMASKADVVMGPATGGRLGGKLKGGFITGERSAKGKA